MKVMTWQKWVFGSGLIALLLYALYLTRTTFILLGISFFLAYLLDPIIDRFEDKGMNRTFAIFLLILLIVLIIVLLFLLIIPEAQKQVNEFIHKAPQWGKWILDHLTPLLDRLSIRYDKESLQKYTATLWQWVRDHLPQLLKPVINAFQHMFSGIANFIVGILNIVIVPVFTFYLLRDFDKIKMEFYALFPPDTREKVKYWVGELDVAVGGFLRGQFTIASILAVIYAIGLSLLNVPLGFLLGIISGLANMVPYMSIVVGLAPALILSFLNDPNFVRLLAVLAVYTGGQLLEGVYLGPKITGKETGLHPVTVMVSIMIGGSLFGLTGIIIAVPSAAVIKVVLQHAIQHWKKQWETGESELPPASENDALSEP